MNGKTDKRALTQWEKSGISYENYQEFIRKKNDRFKLSLIDLLYISNFKGGNATINEPEKDIEDKLKSYSEILNKISEKFNGKTLAELDDEKIEELIDFITTTCDLTHKNKATKIDGFSVSYLSALLNSYFPNLIPILDRRVLINLRLVKATDINKSRQVKNIQNFYGNLVKEFVKLCKQKEKSIREIDKYLFTKELIIPRH